MKQKKIKQPYICPECKTIQDKEEWFHWCNWPACLDCNRYVCSVEEYNKLNEKRLEIKNRELL
jgi:hypothetical protein